METIDYIVILIYAFGIIAAGAVFAGKIKSSSDMFSAGGQSPWWVSGLSGFMTMFSAGTFVVWGGIAFRYGLVAVLINMCYGVAALLAGYSLAGRWRRLGVNSAPEFLRKRFGGSIVQFYTWLQGTLMIFTMGGSIYALALIVCALIPIPEESLMAVLADPATGNLSVPLLSMLICLLVISVAFTGGLWAVLITDVLQFIILSVSVLFVVPLIIVKTIGATGGITALLAEAPTENFWKPIAGDYTWWFLAGWIVIHYFKIGGDWSFVQRFTCVPSAKDARKSAYIFGAMYLVSPILWMLPPLLYRYLNPIPEGMDAQSINMLSEQAYVLACTTVLPAGMVGLMIAAMASATASMATTNLNVYAAAFTTEFYKIYLNKNAGEKNLIRAGRVFTLLLGVLVIAGALLIPLIGYTSYVIKVSTLLTVPLVAPTVWGLFSRKIGLRSVWSVTIVGFLSALLVQFGLNSGGWLAGVAFLEPLAHLVQSNQMVANLVTGIAVPLIVLAVIELFERNTHAGWKIVERGRLQARDEESRRKPQPAPTLPVLMIGLTLLVVGLVMAVLAVFDSENRLILGMFALTQLVCGLLLLQSIRKKGPKL